MADYTQNAPDLGEDDGFLGPPGTSIADRLRRFALLGQLQGKRLLSDPLHTLFPSIGETGATGGRRIGLPIFGMSNVGGDWSNVAPGYVGPNDMSAHKSVPGYVPQQDWQNALQQDPLASWLGPMQKPAPKQPAPPPGL